MAQAKIDALDAAKAVCAALPTPRTQAEWRRASTALRTARKLARARNVGFTAQIACGSSHRYLMCDAWSACACCYNGGGRFNELALMTYYRLRLVDGDRAGRVDGARSFAARSRQIGPAPLPELRGTASVQRLAA